MPLLAAMKYAFFSLILLAACSPVPVDSLYWSAGDRGRINGVEFRLHGVDAPETGGIGSYGGAQCEAERALGYEAKAEIVEFTRGKAVAISRRYETDRYGRLVVDLSVDGRDLAAVMVGRGVLKRWDYDGGQAKPDHCS